MDEISISAKTNVAELKDGEVSLYTVSPGDFGLETADASALSVGSVEESLAMIQSVLANNPGPALDIISMNAGAAIYVSGVTDSLVEGIEKAKVAIASGKAATVLANLVAKTNS